jgi:hypothetical protein
LNFIVFEPALLNASNKVFYILDQFANEKLGGATSALARGTQAKLYVAKAMT